MASTRRLAAILAADVVGFRSRIDADLGGTLRALAAICRDRLSPTFAEYNGRLLRERGDLLLVEFGNVVEALRCATHLQRTIAEYNRNLPAEKRIEFRIGIHQGDVVIQDGHLFGDAVTIATGLEGLAEPGGICLSARAKEDAEGKIAVQFEDMGEQQFKNRSRPVHAYQISPAGVLSGGVSGTTTRRLAAILAADVAGYSRLMGENEEGTHERLKAHLRELVDPKITEHRGRIVKNTGDGFLAEFPSVVDAVRCAVEIQRGMIDREPEVAEERRIRFRVGINLGDVIVEPHDIFGDGVNVAARLEALAEPGGICISRMVRDQIRSKLPYPLEDMGEQSLKNIARPLRVYRVGSSSAAGQPISPAAALPLPDKPSLTVLPFQNMTGDAEQDYFVDGVVEEITTAISRLPWLFVIARNSSFTYKGRAVDVKQVAHELGVRYVLEGSVRKNSSRVRITGQLIDTTTGAHIWADRFDGALDDIFELQDLVASRVVGAIEPRLLVSEMARATRKPTERLDTYDLYLRGLAQYHKLTEEGMREAVRLLRRAIASDRSYTTAAALIAVCRITQMSFGWGVSDAEMTEAAQLAAQSIEMGRDDPDALWMGAMALSYLSGAHGTAASALDRSLALNPNSAYAWTASGWLSCRRNRPEQAIEAFHRAMRLSPLDPLLWAFKGGLALAHLIAGRYDEAVDWADKSLDERPRYASVMRHKIVACVHLGHMTEARELLQQVLRLQPGVTIAWSRAYATSFAPPEVVPLFLEGLRKAGMPEE
jgi:class 3 adenylate cyclase/TolB-like protein/Flp pilus assembly protein TadD